MSFMAILCLCFKQISKRVRDCGGELFVVADIGRKAIMTVNLFYKGILRESDNNKGKGPLWNLV